mmetsp:Transcript_6960/g.17699  ORF Transcript_6960/g.17699 Transcript_6960/m.17699 type:complete len:212 (-) Transcript_6960:940-1575(-)
MRARSSPWLIFCALLLQVVKAKRRGKTTARVGRKRTKKSAAAPKLDSNTRKVAEFAMGTLRNISVSGDLQKRVMDAAIVPLIVSITEKYARESRLVEQCASTIRNLGVDDDLAGELIQKYKVVPILVMLLRIHTNLSLKDGGKGKEGAESTRVLEQVAGALRNLSMSSQYREALVGEGVLPPLIELLNHSDAKVSEQAGIALRNLSEGVED